MAKMTLLEMTQSILSSMGSDEVNSIGDTAESLQVADILKQTYYNMLGRYDLPEHNQLVQLIPSTDSTKPTLMTVPDGITRLEWIKYFDTNPSDSQQQDQFGSFSHSLNLDIVKSTPSWSAFSTTTNTLGTGSFTFTVPSGLNIHPGDPAFCFPGTLPSGSISMSGTVTSYSGTTLILFITMVSGAGTFSQWTIASTSNVVFGPGYKDVPLVPLDRFLWYINQFDPSETNVGSYSLTVRDNATNALQNYTLYFKNNHQPSCCCILSNFWVIFDMYDKTQDSTLEGSKTMSMGWSVPAWDPVDTFIPNINEQHFPLMLNDAKSLAFVELKQLPHQKAEDEVSRQLVSLQKWKAISGKPTYFDELPDFGRRGGSLSGYNSTFRVPNWSQ